MLHLNSKNPSNIHHDTYSKSLIAFKPRQVLLSQHNSRTTMAAFALKDENSTKITSLTPELKGALHESILHYLNRNGFSKTLKRFQSEAQIQSDAWKGSSLHLEDIFCKYSPWNADSNNNTSKKPVLGNDVGTEKEKCHLTNEETTTKKKKKKATVDGDNGAAKDHTEVIDKKRNESSKNLGQIPEDIIVDEEETKPEKKKTKLDMDSSIDAINGLKTDDSTVKTKEKKKKSIEQVTLEPSTTNENELVTEAAQKEKKKKKKSSTDENETIQPDLSKTKEKEKKNIEKVALELSTTNENELVTEVAQKEKKKKKKSSTDENETIQPDLSKTKEKKNTLEPSTTNENGLVTEVAQKEKKKKKKSTTNDNETFQPDLSKQEKKSSKKRKRSSCDENENENGDVQKTETFKEEKSKKEENNVQELSKKQLDGETNGKLEIDGVKSTKKQRIATAEPKTVDAFQRVKIDQVEFAHEKLQDNSYWAKDGAEIGYGAKAQEVLGQVRGRDFRHEKTKKKRGSYRGGSIDLKSHSVKFNYSDEE